ncbi:MAG: signal peptidase II [Melioribacteraceae bacterium]|nr:signal peptidase II [Melioribacteraceae bacterium]
MRVLYLSFFLLITDQVTKFLVKGLSIPIIGIEFKGMFYGESIPLLGEFFKITFVENPGMAFGIDVGSDAKLFLSLFSLIASLGIFYYLYSLRDEKLIIRISLALILAGAFGNLIDRTLYGIIYGYAPIFYGKVVDFFNVDFWDFTIFGRTYERWPIFNIADASVTIGVILLIIFHRSEKKNEVVSPETLEVSSEGITVAEKMETSRTETELSGTEKSDKHDGEISNRKET